MFMATGIFMLAKFKSSDRIYTPLPLYHTAGGVMAVGAALLHGATVVIRKKFSASAYFAECIKYNCTVSSMLFNFFLSLLKENKFKFHYDIYSKRGLILEEIRMWKQIYIINF